MYWDVSQMYGLKTTEKYEYAAEARRPEMIIEDKISKYCKIIDFAVPYDSKSKYQRN